ncbi:MAG: Uma2 family endonuclease [Gemmataceae bacterium]|nr:Uma2 family endonuclease [Gemmataceae bacterium]
MMVRIAHPEKLVYPESDGAPMGESTLHVLWIMALYDGLTALYRGAADVFVAADLFWYPVYGDPTTVTAPDVMVAFGRPKGDRGSYKQWEEANVAPQVVIDVQSPGNTAGDLTRSFDFYRRFKVEEFYRYDPVSFRLEAWHRSGRTLEPVRDVAGVVSPRTGVRFEAPGTAPMRVVRPDGQAFLSYLELLSLWEREKEKEAETARRADALAAKLRELGVDPDRL